MGISSLSKKLMIRQARADYALVEIHLFDVLELSIPFCNFLGLIFVKEEHQKIKKLKNPDFLANQYSLILSDGRNALFLFLLFNNVEFIMTQ